MPLKDFFIPEGVDMQAPVPSRVNNNARKCENKIATAVFATCQLVLVIFIAVAAANAKDPGGMFAAAADAASSSASEAAADMGFSLDGFQGVLTGLLFLVIFIGLAWIFVLQKAARVFVWGTLILNAVCVIVLAAWLNTQEVWIACSVVLCIGMAVVYCKRAAVEACAIMLAQGAHCMRANLGLVGVTMGMQVVMLGYNALVMGGMGLTLLLGTEGETAGVCDITKWEEAPYAQGLRTYMSIMLVWGLSAFAVLRTYTCAGVAGMWYWPSAENSNYPACKSLSWGVSFGFGGVTLSALVIAIMQKLNEMAQARGADFKHFYNPFWWAYRIAMCVYKDFVNALSKFVVIITAVTGEGWFVSVGRTYYTLKGNFGNLFVVDAVAKLVLKFGAIIFALLVGVAGLVLSAAAFKEDPFANWTYDPESDEYWKSDEIMFMVWVGVQLLVSAACFAMPLVGMLVVALFSSVAFWMGKFFTFAVFIACLANFLFSFYADTILDVMSCIFVMVLVDLRNGTVPEGDPKVEGSPAAVGAKLRSLLGNDTNTAKAEGDVPMDTLDKSDPGFTPQPNVKPEGYMQQL
jgi:hypothetical protein